MDDSGNDSPAGKPAGAKPAGGQPADRPMQPIGGMVRDPREIKTNPSLTRFLRDRMSAALIAGLVGIGVLRPRTATGDLGPRHWKGLFAFLGTILAIVILYTSVHVVQPGSVAVPVTFGHAGEPRKAGLHITWPFTRTYSMTIRTQNYTMSALKGEGPNKNSDDSVSVLGRDGGSANVNATVLYRLDPKQASEVFGTLGVNYQTQIVRPSARNCIRIIFTRYDVVTAATSAWDTVETDVSTCMRDKLVPRGLLLQDFQMREVTLAESIRSAVNDKVKAQQVLEQKRFELATSLQQADISRFQALATADSQQIVACGGRVQKVLRDGREISTVVPNPLTECNQTQLTPQYLQFTYIQALQQLATSKSNTTLVLPFDQNLTPLLNLNTGEGSTVVTPPDGG